MYHSNLQTLLDVIESGQMTGSNKMSTVLALIDLVPLMPENSLELDIDQIAEKIIELSWSHVEPFHNGKPLKQLSVNNKEGLVAHTVVKRLKEQTKRSRNYIQAKSEIDPGFWRSQVKLLTSSLKRMPLKRLQTINGKHYDFLYSLDFRGNTLKFHREAKEMLQTMGPSIKIIVEARYIQFVARINMGQVEYSRIENYLFGSKRFMPPTKLENELLRLQDYRCILSGERLSKDSAKRALDHFLPWSKVRVSELPNFSVTSSSINLKKSNYLPSLQVIEKWIEFQTKFSGEIHEIADSFSWPQGTGATSTGLLNLYQNAKPGILVFSGKQLIKLTPEEQRDAIKLLSQVTI